MNLGLSIFLSTILICLIWFYYITRDRWKWDKLRWKKIVKWPGIGLITVTILLLCNFLFYYIFEKSDSENAQVNLNRKKNNSLNESIKLNKKHEKSFNLEGISLGELQNNVKFVKGIPSSTNSSPDYWIYEHMKESNVLNDKDYKYAVIFKNKSVIAIIKEYVNYIINDIWEQGSPNEIITSWGNPSNNIDFDDGLKKLYFYSNKNALMIFEKNSVQLVGIYLPQYENEVKVVIISKNIFLN